MTKTLLIATSNLKKCREMREILEAANLSFELKTLADFPRLPPVDETGETFIENAHLKAKAAVEATGLISIADDGGLSIDALGGSPGVKSHRFLGEETPFDIKMKRILEMMQGTPEAERTARFVSAVVIAAPDGRTWECVGTCEGLIAQSQKGEHGFGYDPIFFLPEQRRHLAELIPAEKHRVSHRGKSLACALETLKTLF